MSAQHVNCPIKICQCESPHLIDSTHLCPCPTTRDFLCAWLFCVASGSSVRFVVRRWDPRSHMPPRGMDRYQLWDFYDGQLQKRLDDAGCLSLRYLRRSRFCIHSIHTGAACRDAGVCLDERSNRFRDPYMMFSLARRAHAAAAAAKAAATTTAYWVLQYLCVCGHRRLVRWPAVRSFMVSHAVRWLPPVSPQQAIVVTWNGEVAATLLETLGACCGLQVDGRLHGELWSPATTCPL